MPCRELRPPSAPQKRYPGYDIKLHLMVNLPFWRPEECGVPFIEFGVVVLVSVSSRFQTDLFENYL